MERPEGRPSDDTHLEVSILEKEENAGPEINPVTRFAQLARKVWKSDLSGPEKREKLGGIRDAIDHYADRLEKKRTVVRSDETAKSFERVRDLLRKMSSDVGRMCAACDPKKSKRLAA